MKTQEIICKYEIQLIYNKRLYESKLIPKELYELVLNNLTNKINKLEVSV